ncbi:MAG: type I DNA topoisomerase [Anaerolineaceae bacterium]|nr:type I DNA topoisomerase [Anaerolineaceae bacterium]
MGRTPEHEGLTPPPRKPKPPRKRKGCLVIVESPAKARTVGKFLGKEYTVKASIGHVRDLLRSTLSVDVDNDFQPKYRVPNEKRQVVKELKEITKGVEEVILATDPDREGEAIAWHLMEAIEAEPERTKRVVFHEITDQAINHAFENPREIAMNMVDAQQARRVLDRLVGYSISPILWKKVRSRLSAGRVQSVALRLVIERERLIQDFVPREYWTIEAELSPNGNENSFVAKLVRLDEDEPEIPNEDTCNVLVTDLEKAAYEVSKVKRGTRRRKPSAPFITSTLQQDASRKFGFTAKKTMRVAQQLYEGMNLGANETVGLITYMRTDSTNISDVAQKEVRKYISNRFGEAYLPEKPPMYKTRAKSAQEAHEAVRPTSVMRSPRQMKEFMSRDQYRLYKLIWQRFVASQMEAAVYDTISVEVSAKTDLHSYLFRASGSTIKFEGFLAVYEESKDEDQKTEEKDVKIPLDMEKGHKLALLELLPVQHSTQPPPRFTEASLVQLLEEYGIGRPSTYAPILSTIQSRGYVERDAKRLYPTEIGFLVNDLLVEHFSNVFDVNFTASMEQDLDKIAAGEKPWQGSVAEFYASFQPQVERADELIPETKAELEKVGRACPKCEHDLVIRWGKFGKFISCSNFPDCRYTEPWLLKMGVDCPDCENGEIVQRKSRRGRIFYGCANYPECSFTSWKQPIKEKCPTCQGLLVRSNKREVQCLGCEETFLADQIIDESSE